MTTNTDYSQPKYFEITPLIETELIHVAHLKLVRATVTVGPMTVTSFSDVIQEADNFPFQKYAIQATYRAMELILRS